MGHNDENVKVRVFQNEKKDMLVGETQFFDVVRDILVSRCNKSLIPLHCVAHLIQYTIAVYDLMEEEME